MATQHDPQHGLVPLELAARALYDKVYRARASPAAMQPEQLNGIAYAIAALLTLYTYAEDGSGVRALGAEEVQSGLFREGGRSMIFLDGRPALGPLAVQCSGLERVAAALMK